LDHAFDPIRPFRERLVEPGTLSAVRFLTATNGNE
jgi:hypothetical protein